MFTVGTTNEFVRYQWTEATLKKIPAGLTILDAGAGECQFKKFCSHLNYVAQDFGQYDGTGEVGLQIGSWDNTKLDIVSDITAIPVPDAQFDAVMCTEVFEHVPDPVAALNELNRVLKKDGYLLITVPFASLTHFAPYHFSSGLSRFWFEHHLQRLGYEILELEHNGNYFEFIAQETRRVKRVAKDYGASYSFLDKIFTHLQLFSLQKLSKQSKKSEQLLCFNIFVFAKKK
jgi:ubiquinone/menaquinone biosynthesis C-methylase UbiE